MTIEKRPSFRKCVDKNCKSCIYDPKVAGTWRQQVTLCSVKDCELYPVRPVTKAPIPEAVLDYYQVTEAEHALYALSRPPKGGFSKHNDGSSFFDIFLTNNKKKLKKFTDDLKKKGYTER